MIICKLFCNLNISLANAYIRKHFVINLLNDTVLIVLHDAIKQTRRIVPIRELEEKLIYDSLVNIAILFSRMSYQF